MKHVDLFSLLPRRIQNLSFSFFDSISHRSRFSNSFYAYFSSLRASEWMSKPEIEDYKNLRFISAVKDAYAFVPFYRKLYDEFGVNIRSVQGLSDLSLLPIITKNDVIKAGNDLLNAKIHSASRVRSGLTSGSTGVPLRVFKTPDSQSFQFAIWWRHRARFGATPSDSRLTFGARLPYFNSKNSFDNPIVGSRFWTRYYLNSSFANESNIHSIVKLLNSRAFDLFEGYPSSIESIANLLRLSGARLTNFPRIIFAGSDQLFDFHAKSWLNAFSAPVSQTYGMVEFAGNLSECQYGQLHEDFECGHIESLPLESSDSYRLILSGWGNPLMPFIRYDIGDCAIPSDSNCMCGRSSRHFTRLKGRSEDFIFTKDGRKITGMNQVFEYALNVKQVQLVQYSLDSVVFRVVPLPGFKAIDLDRMFSEFDARSNCLLDRSYLLCDNLLMSSSGKYKSVLSLM